MLTIADDLLLLVLDDESGRSSLDGSTLDAAVGGGLLLELALAERVDVEESGRLLRQKLVRVVDAAPFDDPVLDSALGTVAERSRTPQDLVSRLGKELRPRLLDRLVERGILRREENRVLGLFPQTRWPAEDSEHEDAVRQRLRDVLVTGLASDERTSALVALLRALDRAHTVLPDLDREQRRTARSRAKAVADGAWAADAVRSSVQAMQTAVLTATTAAAVTTST
ncbi:GOLPH3/VPS74 family protein [Aquipuribacter nitratireducens]|uniref:GPP34 family phosphoprotein n=1 Tax=Aquipuribacter nitratireducens TaxID=650104 RepID=A0ABW0GNX1_9MICO